MANGRLDWTLTIASTRALVSQLETESETGGLILCESEAVLGTIARNLPEDNSWEFSSFGAHAARTADLSGLSRLRIASRGQQRAAMREAIKKLPPESPYFMSAEFPGALEALLNAARILRHGGISSERLLQVAGIASESSAARLRSLAQLCDEETKLLARVGSMHATDLANHLLEIELRPGIVPKRVFGIVYRDTPPVYFAFLKWLSKATDVRLLMPILPTDSFSESFLQRVSVLLGTAPRRSGEEHWTGTLFGDMHHLHAAPRITILETADRLAECEWVLREAQEQMSTGVFAHRMAIFAADASGYAPLLRSAAMRLGVPIAIPTPQPLLENGLVRFVRSFLGALCETETHAFLKISNSSYLSIASDTFSQIQSLQPHPGGTITWEMLGSNTKESEAGDCRLQKILAWRESAIDSQLSLADWTNSLRSFLEDAGVITHAIHNARTRERDQRAYSALFRALVDEAVIQLDENAKLLNLLEFCELAENLWKQETTIVPSDSSGIQFCSSAQSLPPCDHLFAMGMLEGTMPKRRSEEAALPDEDIQFVNQQLASGIPLPDSYDRARWERANFLSICATATQSLTFSYPRTDDESDNVPAFYLHVLEKKLPGQVCRVNRGTIEWTPKLSDCRSPADERLRHELDSPPRISQQNKLESESVIQTTRRSLKDPISIGEISLTALCPFRAYLRYRKRLYHNLTQSAGYWLTTLSEKAGIFTAKDIQSAIASANDCILEVCRELEGRHEDWELALFQSAAQRTVDEIVAREEFSRKEWRESGSQHQFVDLGRAGTRNQLPISGKVLTFSGRVPLLTVQDDRTMISISGSKGQIDSSKFGNEENHRYRIEYGLYLLAQFQQNKVASLEVEAGPRGRTLYYLGAPKEALKVDKDRKVFRVQVAERAEEFFTPLKEELQEIVDQFVNGELRPRAGIHCGSCSYGSLCRYSSAAAHLEMGDSEEES